MSSFDPIKRRPLDLVRQNLLPGFESGQFEHKPAYDHAEFRASYAEDSCRRDSRISVRVSGKDLTELQKLALDEGIPAQTLIGNIIHNYVQNLQLEASRKHSLRQVQQVELDEVACIGADK